MQVLPLMRMEGKFANFLSPGSLTGNIPAQQSYGAVLCGHLSDRCAVLTRIEYCQLTYKAKDILSAFAFENRSKNIRSLCLN